jgi:hypothetical protein
MNPINLQEVEHFVNSHIDEFHQSRASVLKGLHLNAILLKKNPYLFRAKNITTAQDMVNDLLGAYLFSSEEELFGKFLEKLAIFVSGQTCGGRKSGITGIDLEFSNEGATYLVAVKSGPNWSNSSSMKTQKENFRTAVGVMRQNDRSLNVIPVIGICYGRQRTSHRDYMKIVGQNFWEFISGDRDLYTKIIEPLGFQAREHNANYLDEKDKVINLFTEQFLDQFCDNGTINWEKLVKYNSGNALPQASLPEDVYEENDVVQPL